MESNLNRGFDLANEVYLNAKTECLYRSDKIYSLNDIVLFNDRYFISVTDNNNEEPESSLKWNSLCK